MAPRAPPPSSPSTAGAPAPWSERDDALVRLHYPQTGTKRLATLLPGRTRAAVRERARLLGVSAPSSAQSITAERAREVLAQTQGNVTKAAKLCNVPLASFHRRLVALQLTTPRDTGHWPGAELAVLRQYYATEGVDGVAKRLPHRTKEAIRKQADRQAAKEEERQQALAKRLAAHEASRKHAQRQAATRALRQQALRNAARKSFP